MEKEHVKNRQATEQLLLEAVNRLVEQDGFEGLGINAVAAQAGVYQGAVPAANRRATEQLYPAAPLPLGTLDRQRTGGRVA